MRVFLVYLSVLPSARSDVCSDAEIFPYVTRATCPVSSAVPKNRSVRPLRRKTERRVHWLFPFFSLLGSSTFWHVIDYFVVAPKTSQSRFGRGCSGDLSVGGDGGRASSISMGIFAPGARH